MKKEIHIYHHVCLMNNGLEIALDQLHLLYTSDLLNNATSINIGIKYEPTLKAQLPKLLDIINRYNEKHNIKILYLDENDFMGGDHELKTARFFKSYADTLDSSGDSYILYLHTKGVSRHGTPLEIGSKHWRMFMEYFTITKWKDCYSILDNGYESCGTYINKMSVMYNAPDIVTMRNRYINNTNSNAFELTINENNVYYPGTFYWMNTSLLKKIPRKYFVKNNEYGNWAIEALPGLVEHKYFSFTNKSGDYYGRIILPNEYMF